MTRIWWCQEHNSQSHGEHTCIWAYNLDGASPCRVVPMRLIPDNAERLIYGALRAWNPDLNDFSIQNFAIEVIEALDGETP